ncbi:hypothetical protein ACOMHN_026732 [Nucella lapillus]
MAVEPEKRQRKDSREAVGGTATTTTTTSKEQYTNHSKTRTRLLPRERTTTADNTYPKKKTTTTMNDYYDYDNNNNNKVMIITSNDSYQKTAAAVADSEKTSVTNVTTVTNVTSTVTNTTCPSGGLSKSDVVGDVDVDVDVDVDDEVVPGERVKLTHEKVDIRPTKNIKMKQHLCVKHALPKTRLTNAILYENVSQGRHLDMKLAVLQHDKHKSSFSMDLNKRAFVAQQDRKRHKWKREDEVRIAAMNLPSFSPVGDKPSSTVPGRKTAMGSSSLRGHRRPSVETIYHMSGNEGRAESAADTGRKPLLPMMKIRRERTEIVSHQDKVFVTKLPSVVEVDQHKLNVHNAYRGKSLLDRGVPSRDDRFRRLHTTLSPAILTEEDQYPSENMTTKSRFSKYVSTSPAGSDPLPPTRAEARVMVASQGKSQAQGLGDLSVSSAPGGQRTHAIDFITERKKGGGKDIVDLFRSKDIKSLARSLTTDAAGMRVGMGVRAGGGGRGDDTDRSMSKPRPHNVFVPVVDVFYKVKTGS